MENKKNKYYYLSLSISLILGYIANLFVGSVAKYGIKGISLKSIEKIFPYSSSPAAIFAAIAVPAVCVIAIYSSQLNKKNYSHKGTEFGSAQKGKLEEIEPLIEKTTYWLNGIAVRENQYKDFVNNKQNIKDKWIEVLNKQSELKNPKYKNTKESFTNWIKDYAKVETNPSGTTNNMILSQNIKLGYFQARRKNKNVVVVGGAGTGKTRGLIKPNIMQLNTSFVITDPKGTILQEIGTMLYMNGYDIKIFNLLDFESSMKYNPFNYVYNELDVITLANTLIENTQGQGEKADFWVKAEMLLYQALFWYVKKHLPVEQQNFGFIVEMLSVMDVVEEDPEYKNAIDIVFDEIEKDYEEMSSIDPTYDKPFELSCYQEFKLAAGKTLKSILISCAARLKAFNVPQIKKLVEKDELEIEKRDDTGKLISCYGDHKTALFCITSDSDSSNNFLVAMLYTQMFNTLMNTALKEFGGNLPVHIKFLLDEFANIGQIPKFDEIISVIRSRNISTMIILQAKSQLKKIYKEAAETIIGNCDTEIFLGGKEMSTLKEVVESLGKETIDYQNDSKSYSKNQSQSISSQKTGADLISINELKTMKDDECIVQVRGINPFVKVKKYDITKHPQFKYHVDADDTGNPLIFNERKFVKHLRLKAKEAENQTFINNASFYQQLIRKPHTKIRYEELIQEEL